jgi:hypothetical protein
MPLMDEGISHLTAITLLKGVIAWLRRLGTRRPRRPEFLILRRRSGERWEEIRAPVSGPIFIFLSEGQTSIEAPGNDRN